MSKSDRVSRSTVHTTGDALLTNSIWTFRFGIHSPKLYNIQYFGRGPGENYPDRKSGSEMGVYNTTPTDMAYYKYIVPGENGSRSDCEHCVFRSDEGDGFAVVQRKPDGNLSTFSCSALLHSITELHEASHTCDLEPRENGKHPIYVNIDHKMMGVGGDTR